MTAESCALQGRSRPQSGAVIWHDDLNGFECRGCGGFVAVRSRRIWSNPYRLTEFREQMEWEHAACWLYATAAQAWAALRLRQRQAWQRRIADRASLALDRMARRQR